jgi:excisionase family DNA binding protein
MLAWSRPSVPCRRDHVIGADLAKKRRPPAVLTAEYVSTTQVAEALGVSVSSVKRWVEDGILPAHKTAGGHRKLLLADVLALARQGDLPVRDLACLSGASSARPVGSPTLVDRLYKALLAGSVDDARAVLHGTYRAGMPIETLGDTVVAPALHRIGDDWQRKQIDVMHEHRATQLCVNTLVELKAMLEVRAGKRSPVAVGGALQNDFSAVPTLLAQMVLLDAGWDAINLGPNTPLASFERAIDELKPRLLWLSASHMQDRDTFIRDYRKLYAHAEKTGVAVVVGGRALVDSLRAAIPYTSFGDGFTHLAAFARTLSPPQRRPRRGRPPKSS